jgi:hypothetical protein
MAVAAPILKPPIATFTVTKGVARMKLPIFESDNMDRGYALH